MRDSDREMEGGGRGETVLEREGERKVERERGGGSEGMSFSKGESSYPSLVHILRKIRCLTPLWQIPFLLLP